MCYNYLEKNHLINAVNSLWKDNGQRWALIKNKSGNLEVIPETSIEEIEEEIIYKLKN